RPWESTTRPHLSMPRTGHPGAPEALRCAPGRAGDRAGGRRSFRACFRVYRAGGGRCQPLVCVIDSARAQSVARQKKRPGILRRRARPRCAAALGALEVTGGLLAPLSHHVVANLLALPERAETGALNGRDVNEHVLGSVARLDKAEAFGGIEELYCTDS